MTLTEHFSVAGVFRDKIQHTFRFHHLSRRKTQREKLALQVESVKLSSEKRA